MAFFSIPDWVKLHSFEGKNFDDLSPNEVEDLRYRLSQFQHSEPDVSIMIPAWNEQNNIYRALSSLASNKTKYKVEIAVINNNSTDRTQEVLEILGVRNYLQPEQGTPHARQMGLDMAKGKYHLCADSDTFYPPDWIGLMVAPMEKDKGITGVYGCHSFIPPEGKSRIGLIFYEKLAGVFVLIRKKNREFLNVFGFNMGFITEVGRNTGGFRVSGKRVYSNIVGSDYHNEAEDGRMALNLKTKGRLKRVTNRSARVFTSPRRLLDDGSIWNAFLNRAKVQISNFREYTTGKQ